MGAEEETETLIQNLIEAEVEKRVAVYLKSVGHILDELEKTIDKFGKYVKRFQKTTEILNNNVIILNKKMNLSVKNRSKPKNTEMIV